MADFSSYFRITVGEGVKLKCIEKGGYNKWDRHQDTITIDSVFSKNFPGKLKDGPNGSSKGSDGFIIYESEDGVKFRFHAACPVSKTKNNEGSYEIIGDEKGLYKVDARYNNSDSETEGFDLKMHSKGHPVHCKFKVTKKQQ